MEFDILLKEESLRYQGTLRATIKMEKNVQSRNPVSSPLSIIIYSTKYYISMILFTIILKIKYSAKYIQNKSLDSVVHSEWSIYKRIGMEINNQQISWLVSIETVERSWRVIESMLSTGNSRVCRITVGGSREKERTCGIQVAGHVPRAKRHQDITGLDAK